MPHCAPCMRPHCFRMPESGPSEGGGNKDWRSWNILSFSLSIGINGNRRSDGVFFQSMARMIGDETLLSHGEDGEGERGGED